MDALKSARVLKNLSLRDVESAVGISNAYLSQLESGKIKKPSPFFIHKLSDLYGVPYESLMESVGYIKRRGDQSPHTFAGSVLFSQSLNPAEEEGMLEYLKFLRTRKA